MAQIIFKKTKQTKGQGFGEALGFTEERTKQLRDVAHKITQEADTKSEIIELIEQLEGVTVREQLFLSMILGALIEHNNNHAEEHESEIAEVLADMPAELRDMLKKVLS